MVRIPGRFGFMVQGISLTNGTENLRLNCLADPPYESVFIPNIM
jgi:hypothetical protein